MKKLAIITVTYNAEKNLSFFLPSLEKNKEAIQGVYFVDNNSQDKTLSTLEVWNEITAKTIIINKKNYGYAYAINKGIQKALDDGYDYFCVTNNDIVFNEEFFNKLLKEATDNDIDALGVPASINETDLGLGYLLDTDTLLPKKTPPLQRSTIPALITTNPLPSIDAPHGGTILFNRDFFKKIGLYDSELFFGGDELDFLYRIHKYNTSHDTKVRCVVSLGSFFRMDNLTKHNTGDKIIKARGMLQGSARVYLKHRFTPFQFGLFREQYRLIQGLSKGSLIRYMVLYLFSLRGLCIEIKRYYLSLFRKA